MGCDAREHEVCSRIPRARVQRVEHVVCEHEIHHGIRVRGHSEILLREDGIR